MIYYLVFNMMYNDGTKSNCSEYMYSTANEAIANFHKQLGGWMAKDNVAHILAMVVNSEGGVLKNETYTAPEEEEEEEEEDTTETTDETEA